MDATAACYAELSTTAIAKLSYKAKMPLINTQTMKEFKYTIDGKKYEVAVGTINGLNVEVTVNGETYNVELEAKPKAEKKPVVVKAPKQAAGADAVKESLKSPLPGVINDIKVKVGDVVEEGQTLVVLEAMKMANNLDAEKGGKVAEILVEVGESVMENTPLVVFE